MFAYQSVTSQSRPGMVNAGSPGIANTTLAVFATSPMVVQRPLPIVETMGSGCAFLDYDNDGRPDLFLVSSGQDFRAARQRPGCKLSDHPPERSEVVAREPGSLFDPT